MQVIGAKMSYMGERQAVLAQNVANADTPDYRAKDMKPFKFHNMVSPLDNTLKMARTDGQHMSGLKNQVGMFQQFRQDLTYETNPNENTVVIEEEMSKVAMTQMEYQKSLSLYRKNMELFRSALGRNSG